MKRCPRCGEVKPLSEFPRNPGRRDGVHSICKTCRRIYEHERYERLHGKTIEYRPLRSERGRGAWLRSLKEGRACTDCGRAYPPQVMQWDHKPGYEKVGDISEAFWGTRSEWGKKWLKEQSTEYEFGGSRKPHDCGRRTHGRRSSHGRRALSLRSLSPTEACERVPQVPPW